jgi:hypothetical protein
MKDQNSPINFSKPGSNVIFFYKLIYSDCYQRVPFVILSVPLGPGGEYSDVSEGYGLKRDDELPADDRPLNADPFIENGDLSPCAEK